MRLLKESHAATRIHSSAPFPQEIPELTDSPSLGEKQHPSPPARGALNATECCALGDGRSRDALRSQSFFTGGSRVFRRLERAGAPFRGAGPRPSVANNPNQIATF